MKAATCSTPWPTVAEEALVQDEIELMLQVNGSCAVRSRSAPTPTRLPLKPPPWFATTSPVCRRQAPPKKVIVVPGRLVNVVV